MGMNNLSYLRPRRNRVGYLGWVGHGNLGDEAMYLAIQRGMPKLGLLPFKLTEKVRLLEKARLGRGLFKSVMLGGGTLINAPRPLARLREGINRYGHGMMLGAGVRNPMFWDRVEGYPNTMEQWVETLSDFRFPSVRGPMSKQVLSEYGMPEVEVVGDPALGLADLSIVPKGGNRRIGLNIGISDGLMWGQENEIQTWAATLARILLEKGWLVTLFPVWPPDVRTLQEVAKATGGEVEVFSDFLNVEKSLGFLRSLDLLIGLKLHAVVMAHCVYTPAIMLEYRPKCRDHMASLCQEHLTIRTDELNHERVLNLVETAVADSSSIQQNLFTTIEAFRTRQSEIFGDLEKEVIQRSYRFCS